MMINHARWNSAGLLTGAIGETMIMVRTTLREAPFGLRAGEERTLQVIDVLVFREASANPIYKPLFGYCQWKPWRTGV